MPQFDVYRGACGRGFLLDCQNDVWDSFDSRTVAPLLPLGSIEAVPRLNPVFIIDGAPHVLATQLSFAIPTERLNAKVGALAEHRYDILNAFDMLISGI
jgi:toxin CcdB